MGYLNGDGRQDIVLANSEGHSISIFLNHGALTFMAADMPLDMSANDVVARDLDGDGKIDLVVAMAARMTSNPTPTVRVLLMSCSATATARLPSRSSTHRARCLEIVLGDFTRDGILDIATANRSWIARDDCGITLKTWDTISILPGNGGGTFGVASSFSLGDQSKLTNQSYKNTVVSLNTSDLNGDHATDLIASWGAVLINKPADPNWSPSVTASSTQPAPGDRSVTISAVANDSDQDMLLYSWTDNGGTLIPPIPSYCFTPITFGVHTFTVTVDDQHGHTASSSVTTIWKRNRHAAFSHDRRADSWRNRPRRDALHRPLDRDRRFGADQWIRRPVLDRRWRALWLCPGCSNLPASARSCLWSDPDSPTQTARVFVVARLTNGPSGSATTGRFTIRSGSGGGGGGLPIGWSQADIGAVSAAGSASVTNGVWTVKGSGADIWGTADEFHYAWVPSTGPENFFEITARVTNVENVDRWTKVGLMIRSSQAANAPQAAIFVTPSSEKGIVFQRRQTTGAASLSTTGPSITAPVWLS